MMKWLKQLHSLLTHSEQLLQRIEHWLPPIPPLINWQQSIAARWQKNAHPVVLQKAGFFHALAITDTIDFADLQHIDEQKQRLLQNTQQFIQGKPANNALLTGARGTGKSSLIKACLQTYHSQGLRLIEINRHDLVDLPFIIEPIAHLPYRFIIFCDDLGFENGDDTYKSLKTALDGGLGNTANNVLIYATSNRRHLLPESFSDRSLSLQTDDDLHPFETSDEKIALSERFGLWLMFYSFSQGAYLDIVQHWLAYLGYIHPVDETLQREALQWALQRGSRSGRVAWQFAKDYVGRNS